jgi:short-subunit dehydrogenase
VIKEQEKVAIITGASRGIGKALSFHLASLKYKVILIARNENDLKEICAQMTSSNHNASYYAIDISDSVSVQNCIESVIKKHGQINLLINNAAILKRGTTEISDLDITEQININLTGAIHVAKYVSLHMKNAREGYIINISSLGGKTAMPFSGVYAASKFGLSGYSEALTKEMSLYDVKVTAICPSMIATEMAKGRKFSTEQMIQLSDIIKTVDYLLSLSKNAIPQEILLSCMPLIKANTESIIALYLK